METYERVLGGLYGLLVGDALGVPYEFHESWEIPEKDLIEYQPPEGFIRAHGRVPCGTWSDDGAQALCLLESLVDNDDYNEVDFTNRLIAWCDEGYMCVDGYKFDIGFTTQNAILMYRLGATIQEATQNDERSNGNGSLMRVLPLALWADGSYKFMCDIARQQSIVTHGHIRSQVCCAVYVLWARFLREGGYGEDFGCAWDEALNEIERIYADDEEFMNEYNEHIKDKCHVGRGSGYVVDSLFSAKMLIDQCDSYEDVVKTAISLGDDTDTTACIAGGIAGIIYGYNSIPIRWIAELRGKNILHPIVDKFMEKVWNCQK